MSVRTVTSCYMCMVTRPSRVYINPTDQKPSTIILSSGESFLSYKQSINNTGKMFLISSPVNQQDDIPDIPYDTWVSESFLECTPVEIDDIDQIVDRVEYFMVHKENITLYENSQSRNPIPSTLIVDDFIETDKYIKHTINNKEETRCRIVAINDDTDNEFVGKWIVSNYTLSFNDSKIDYTDNQPITKMDTKPKYRIRRKSQPLKDNKPKVTSAMETLTGDKNLMSQMQESTLGGKPYNASMMVKLNHAGKSNATTYYKVVVVNGKNALAGTSPVIYLDKLKNVSTYKGVKDTITSIYKANRVNLKWFPEDKSCTPPLPSGVGIGSYGSGLHSIYWKAMEARHFEVEKNKNKKANDEAKKKAKENAANDAVSAAAEAAADTAVTFADYIGDTAEAMVEHATEVLAETSWVHSYSDILKKYGYEYNKEHLMDVPIGRMVFVHGMPFQYTYLTDRRPNNSNAYGKDNLTDTKLKGGNTDMYGRMFASDIASNLPIATIVPGVPKFMANISQSIFTYGGLKDSKDAKDGWLPAFTDLTDSALTDVMNSIVQAGENKVYQYFTLAVDTKNYFRFVNSMCQTTARFMQIGDFKFRGKGCQNFDWETYNSATEQDYSMFEEIVGVSNGISFAFDPTGSISDSMANQVGDSAFAGMFNSISEKARELEFMTGVAGINAEFINSVDYQAAIGEATTKAGVGASVNSALSQVATFIKNAGHGMNIRFPQIWNDSSFSKSYDMDMKFITPYATAFCKWRYVLVPFLHIFTLAAPQSKDSLVNYSRPFLIKAYSRGYFNVEMGIIDNIQWRRFGEGDMISADGIPTEIDVSVSFQDLYQQLAISMSYGNLLTDDTDSSKVSRMAIFFNNTGLMDLLGSLSGVNTNRMNLGERLSLYASTAVGAFKASGNDFMTHIQDRLRNSTFVQWIYGM